MPETGTTETTEAASGALKRPPEVRSMFDRIVGHYDLMNTLMTAGRHRAWRRRAARAAIGARAARVLDLATGTGDLALELAGQGVPLVVGADFSGGMLASAAAKRAEYGAAAVRLVQADAMRLPFPDASFDAVTIGFGLRNLPDYGAAVAEMARVLRPGGRLVILEMSPLRQPIVRRGFDLYFAHLVPLVGGLVSGDREAYGYLPRSVGAFPPPEQLMALMRQAGLRNVRYEALALGTVALHLGIRQ
ncbi:MAG TPA: bifunctional demethylmenaquinone methyltransferase/2-methoxy-6-polyprenyl-1,4-benzoquinol methylase UbiE [Thermomicrobiaceae bacterium]|nr:bifunctional demethylmenaquinone methyltransferase/2-methoxy-6-polyprenyl-1,4-benzoquinol methylase UbiE [Thermomicrobiaceae bacterium]